MGHPNPGFATGQVELGEVVSVADPEALNRVQVRFLSRGAQSGDSGRDSVAWALVSTGFAGDRNGAFLIPDVGTRVVLSCINGDPRYPVVLGAVWDGSTQSPETLPGDTVDRWSFTGKAGTRIAMVEENGSTIVLETARGNRIEIDDSRGRIKMTQGGNSFTMDGSGISMTAPSVSIDCSTFSLSGLIGTFDMPLADFSGFVMCELLQTNCVLSTTYTPGAGNML
jgi:phage baseplate assembly protein gpV